MHTGVQLLTTQTQQDTRRLFPDFPWASNRDCNSADDPAFAAKMTPDATYRYRRHERFSPTRACGWGFS